MTEMKKGVKKMDDSELTINGMSEKEEELPKSQPVIVTREIVVGTSPKTSLSQNIEKAQMEPQVTMDSKMENKPQMTPEPQMTSEPQMTPNPHVTSMPGITAGYGSYMTSLQQAQNQPQPTKKELKEREKAQKKAEKRKNKNKRVTENKRTTGSASFMKKAMSIALAGVLFGSVAGASFIGVNYLMGNDLRNHSNGTSKEVTQETATSAEDVHVSALTTSGDTSIAPSSIPTVNSTSQNMTVEEIADTCMSSIVAITNVGVSQVSTFWGVYETESQSTGSGIIIGETDSELLIVTNYHVVSGCNELTVVFSYDENSVNPNAVEAKVKGYDADRDLAVIAVEMDKLDQDVRSEISIAVLGDSSSLNLGEQVVAIGNALGYGQSVTVGYVSALNRTMEVESEKGNVSEHAFIQTDAAINPGNSGGALFNMRGELIGINSLKVASSEIEGMGYAIPISDVEDIISQLMTIETRDLVDVADRGYLGIKGQSVTSEISSFGIPVGAYVNEVAKDSAAEKAGIIAGDVITEFDGKTITSFESLQDILQYYAAGEKVDVVVMRQAAGGYQRVDLTLTLCSAKEAGISETNTSSNTPNQDSNGAYNFGNGSGSSDGDGSLDSLPEDSFTSDELDDLFQHFFGF